MNGLHEEAKEEAPILDTTLSEKKQEERTQSDGEGKRGQVPGGDEAGGDEAGGDEAGGDEAGGDEEAKTEASPAPASVTKQLTSLEKYQRLADTIDAFTATLGDFDSSNFVYTERTAPLQFELEDLFGTLGELDTLRTTLTEHASVSDNNARLAIDVRNAMSRFIDEVYLTHAKWID